MTTEQPIAYDPKDLGIRYQAQQKHDGAAATQNYDTSQTSRPDAVPTWDDLTEREQDEIIAGYAEDGSLWDYQEVPWHGSETAVIASETNPWLRDELGEDIDLTDLFGPESRIIVVSGCGECFNGPVPGVLPAMDTPHGIQRCDTCGVYEGDLQAARALRDELYPDTTTVWFYGTN